MHNISLNNANAKNNVKMIHTRTYKPIIINSVKFIINISICIIIIICIVITEKHDKQDFRLQRYSSSTHPPTENSLNIASP